MRLDAPVQRVPKRHGYGFGDRSAELFVLVAHASRRADRARWLPVLCARGITPTEEAGFAGGRAEADGPQHGNGSPRLAILLVQVGSFAELRAVAVASAGAIRRGGAGSWAGASPPTRC